MQRTKFSGRDLDLVTDEKWHQRWYRDKDKRESETDILLVFQDVSNKGRYAIHIENKPRHGRWEEGQAEHYRSRALDKKAAWRYSDFQTALIAPFSFIERWPAEVAHFDFTVSYEDISAFIPAFGV